MLPDVFVSVFLKARFLHKFAKLMLFILLMFGLFGHVIF